MPTIAWTVEPRRVVWPQRRRSHRPLSSSARRRRVLVSNPHTAPRIVSVMPILNTVNPLTVCSCGAGPKRALIALLPP